MINGRRPVKECDQSGTERGKSMTRPARRRALTAAAAAVLVTLLAACTSTSTTVLSPTAAGTVPPQTGKGGTPTRTVGKDGRTTTPAGTAIGPAVATAVEVPAKDLTPWTARRATKKCIGLAGRSTLKVAGKQGSDQLKQRKLASKTTIDARTASWSGEVNYPILVDGGRGACIVGATAMGTWPPKTTWSEMHDVAVMRLSNAASIVEDVRFHDYGDGIRLIDGAQDFLIRRAYLSYMRDDCIENDYANSGIIQDSLFDGCYNAFSSRQYDGMDRNRDGSGDVWLIRDSLVRLQPMESVYKERGKVPGHAGFFKWDAEGPQIQLVNNVFRADQDANTVGLDIPLDKLRTCSGNTMVWLGEGPYPGTLPACFTLTRDRSVWDAAVAKWKASHGY